MMNKTELISDVAGKANMTKKDVEKVLSALFSSIEEALKNQEKVQLVGFGTFEVRDRKARTGRNPQTGEEIKIPASRVPAFKAGKTLKDAVV
jgi:DNA-binding protein HU-beta